MQFLKSIFCLQGFDTRTRFIVICSVVYVVFIMLTSAFTDNILLSILTLILSTPILAFTSLRRIKDAKLNKSWLFLPNILFILIALIVIFSENNNYYLLIIPALCLTVLLTYPSVIKKNSVSLHYILGYFGPVDMSEYQQMTPKVKHDKYRIEPTLTSNNSVSTNSSINNDEQVIWQSHETISSNDESEQQIDVGEKIRLNLLHNRKIQLAIVIILSVVLVNIGVSWVIPHSPKNKPSTIISVPVKLHGSTQETLQRKHPLAMPDNFSLFLSQHQGIIINWQADEVSTPLLWSQSSAQGEESCQKISFNKGEPIRTLMVQVENNTTMGNSVYNDYYASFSPLDSKALVRSLAFRGSFSLCGYDFSLKGSQAVLGKSKQYAGWLEY